MVLGYNTNLVKRNEAPKVYDDLLNPRWKGGMFLDDEAFEWLAVLLKHFGREKGLQYMKRLAQQDLSMQRGRTGQTQLLVAGERPIGIYLSGHTVLDLKDKGAPIGWVALDPYFAQANMLMLAKRAPHPYAAALFMDWGLSEEGQAMITTFWPCGGAQRRETEIPRADGEKKQSGGHGHDWSDSVTDLERIPRDLSA